MIHDGMHRARGAVDPDHPDRGTCILCMRFTRTCVGFQGTTDWAEAALAVLGVPAIQAEIMVEDIAGTPGHRHAVPDENGWFLFGFVLCQRCADEHKIQVGDRWNMEAQVPCYRQPTEEQVEKALERMTPEEREANAEKRMFMMASPRDDEATGVSGD